MDAGLDPADLELILGPEPVRVKARPEEYKQKAEEVLSDVADCLESLVKQFEGVKERHLVAFQQLKTLSRRASNAAQRLAGQ